MSTWIRLYTEVIDDPKAQRLRPELFKTWINLLCLAGRNDGRLPRKGADLAFSLRMSEADAQAHLDELIAAGLIDRQKNGPHPHNWNKRQFRSDNVTERVRKHRMKRFNSGAETLHETPPEQNRAESEQSQTRPEQKGREGAQRPASDDVPPGDEGPENPDRYAWEGLVVRLTHDHYRQLFDDFCSRVKPNYRNRETFEKIIADADAYFSGEPPDDRRRWWFRLRRWIDRDIEEKYRPLKLHEIAG